jgi:hypothetical protein
LVQTRSEAYNAPFQRVLRFFPGAKRSEREINSTPFSVVIKNEWSYISAPRGCLHDVDGEDFTFTFIYLCIYLFIRGFFY